MYLLYIEESVRERIALHVSDGEVMAGVVSVNSLRFLIVELYNILELYIMDTIF